MLARQLKKLGLDAEQPPPSAAVWQQFLERISRAYEEGDQDRYLLERSLTISSREMQQRYEQVGATVAIMLTRLFFPEETPGISRWRNEWFSAHLMALHETVLKDWAQDSEAEEAYRFSYLPSLGKDITMRFWS
ncbi:MAG: hypothetical protein IH787_06560, partial [Nitrospirae bacterium]|nr:hypothetical protein [Nitrospirota bacterium]